MVDGAADIPSSSYHGRFPARLLRDAAAMAADGAGHGNGWEGEVRSHEVQPGLLRPAAGSGETVEVGRNLCRDLPLYRRVAQYLALRGRRVSPIRPEQRERNRRWRRYRVDDYDGAQRDHGRSGCLRPQGYRHAQRSA